MSSLKEQPLAPGGNPAGPNSSCRNMHFSRRDLGAQRELFHLPMLDPPLPVERVSLPKGRRVRQRILSSHRLVDEANDTIRSLNWCYGGAAKGNHKLTAAQQEAHRHILSVHRCQEPPPSDLSAQAAIIKLLGGVSDYGGGQSVVAACDETLISIPSAGSNPTQLSSLVSWRVSLRSVSYVSVRRCCTMKRRGGEFVKSSPISSLIWTSL